MRRRAGSWIASLLFAGVSSAAHVVFAQPKPEPPKAAPKPEPPKAAPKPEPPKAAPKPEPAGAPKSRSDESPTSASVRRKAAVQTLADELAETLPLLPARAEVVVAVAPLVSDVNAPKGAALATLLGALVAGKLERAAPPGVESEADARRRARKASHLVYVSPRIERGRFLATLDVFALPATVWARARQGALAPMAHTFAEAPIDAEVRAYLEPVTLTQLKVFRGKNFETDVLALACDDLDRDGAPEIVSVSRQRVTLLRLRDEKVQPIHSRAWGDLSGRHPAPLREPIGFVTIARSFPEHVWSERRVVASTTDRLHSVVLDGTLATVEAFPALAVPDAESFACARLPSLVVTGPLERCSPDSPAPERVSVGGRYDAFASMLLVDPTGKTTDVAVGREDDAIELWTGGNARKLGGGGAQLALGDLDQDGVPELLSSLDVLGGDPDAILLRSVPSSGKISEALRIPIASGVFAFATCPPESSSRPAPFVVATRDEILVVR